MFMYEPFIVIMRKIIDWLTNNPRLFRFIKFGLIGASGIVVNSAMLWLLHEYAGMDIFIASPLAIATAIFNNYSWNDRFTWNANRDNRKHSYIQRLWKYYFSAALGAFLNYGVLLLLTLGFGWHYLLSNLAGIVTGMLSNFLLSEFWVFQSKPDENATH